MGPDDQVILVTHQPRWLMDWFWEEAATHNLRQLVRGHLRGRARVHLAGQICSLRSSCSSAAKLCPDIDSCYQQGYWTVVIGLLQSFVLAL